MTVTPRTRTLSSVVPKEEAKDLANAALASGLFMDASVSLALVPAVAGIVKETALSTTVSVTV